MTSMTSPMLAALATFCFVSSITPGPNNMMLLASGANFGFTRTVPHLLGVTIGFGLMVLAIGFGVGGVFVTYPALYTALRVAGTLYLLWLAWRIATADGIGERKASTRPMTFLEAAAFQWVNPKAWAMALSGITAFAAQDNFVFGVLSVAAVFSAINLPCVASWAGFGTLLQRLLAQPWRLRTFNVTMALALVLSIYPMMKDLAA